MVGTVAPIRRSSAKASNVYRARQRPASVRAAIHSGAGAGESGASGRDGGGNRKAGGDGDGADANESTRDRGNSVAVEAAASGGSDALITAGIAGTVLGLGLLIGFGLRRLLRSE